MRQQAGIHVHSRGHARVCQEIGDVVDNANGRAINNLEQSAREVKEDLRYGDERCWKLESWLHLCWL